MSRFAAKNEGPPPISRSKTAVPVRKQDKWDALMGWEVGEDPAVDPEEFEIEDWSKRKKKFLNDPDIPRRTPKYAWETYTCLLTERWFCSQIEYPTDFKENLLHEKFKPPKPPDEQTGLKSASSLTNQTSTEKSSQEKFTVDLKPNVSDVFSNSKERTSTSPFKSQQQSRQQSHIYNTTPKATETSAAGRKPSIEDVGLSRAKRLINIAQNQLARHSTSPKSTDGEVASEYQNDDDVQSVKTQSDASFHVHRKDKIKSAKDAATTNKTIPKRTSKSAQVAENGNNREYSQMLSNLAANRQIKLSYSHGKSPRDVSPCASLPSSGDSAIVQNADDSDTDDQNQTTTYSIGSASEAFVTAMKSMKTGNNKIIENGSDESNITDSKSPMKRQVTMVLTKICIKNSSDEESQNTNSVNNTCSTPDRASPSNSAFRKSSSNPAARTFKNMPKSHIQPTTLVLPVDNDTKHHATTSGATTSVLSNKEEHVSNEWTESPLKDKASTIPIGDLLPAVDKLSHMQYKNSMPARTTKVPESFYKEFSDRDALDYHDNASIVHEGIDIIRLREALPLGPPGFRPQQQKTPLQRARDITQKRIYSQLNFLYGQDTDDINGAVRKRWPAAAQNLGSDYVPSMLSRPRNDSAPTTRGNVNRKGLSPTVSPRSHTTIQSTVNHRNQLERI